MNPVSTLEHLEKALMCDKGMRLYWLPGKLFNLFLGTVFQRIKRGNKCPQKSEPRNSYQITNANTIWQGDSTSRKLFYRHTHMRTRLFITALFVVAKDWTQSICPSSGDCWIWITVALYNGLSRRAEKEWGSSLYADKGRYTVYIVHWKMQGAEQYV